MNFEFKNQPTHTTRADGGDKPNNDEPKVGYDNEIDAADLDESES